MIPSNDELLFMAASSFVEAANRRAFLEFACRGDADQLQHVEELLEILDDAEEYFKPPELPAPDSDGANEGGLGTRLGPYRLIDHLGSGGCGVVYLAEQQEPVKRKVALKVIRLEMDTESVVSRFNLEREALALMDHPN
ncbi:MAG: serine/threonine protein kinase, partial [Verrucomicrobiaceae bacterium]